MRPDAFPLANLVVHDSPADVATWPVTVGLASIDMAPGASGGVSFTFDPPLPAVWDFHVPGWGNPATGDPGIVSYTVWACALIAGVWHGAGFIQMWRDRPSTGASLPTHWSDWAYDANRWGPLASYVPQAGDQMAFFVTAGNARDVTSVTSVRERSNLVIMDLFSNDTGHVDFPSANPAPVPIPTPVPMPTPVPPSDEIAALSAKIDALNLKLDALALKPFPKYSGTLFGAKFTLSPS